MRHAACSIAYRARYTHFRGLWLARTSGLRMSADGSISCIPTSTIVYAMSGVDRRRFNGPESSSHIRVLNKSEAKPLIASETGLRGDGRKPEDIRPICRLPDGAREIQEIRQPMHVTLSSEDRSSATSERVRVYRDGQDEDRLRSVNLNLHISVLSHDASTLAGRLSSLLKVIRCANLQLRSASCATRRPLLFPGQAERRSQVCTFRLPRSAEGARQGELICECRLARRAC